MPTLSYAEQKKIIERGESVIHDGVLYSTVESLPNAAALAGDDPVKLDAADADLEAQEAEIKKLRDQIAKKKETAAKEKKESLTPSPGDKKNQVATPDVNLSK